MRQGAGRAFLEGMLSIPAVAARCTPFAPFPARVRARLSAFAAVALLVAGVGCGAGVRPGDEQPASGGGEPSTGSGDATGGSAPAVGPRQAAELAGLPQATVYRVFVDLSPLASATEGCFHFASRAAAGLANLELGSFYQLPNRYQQADVVPGQLGVAEWALVDWQGTPTLLVPPIQLGPLKELQYEINFGRCDLQARSNSLVSDFEADSLGMVAFDGGGLPLKEGLFSATFTLPFDWVGGTPDFTRACAAYGRAVKVSRTLRLETSGLVAGAETFSGKLTLGRTAVDCQEDSAGQARTCRQLEPNDSKRAPAAACAMSFEVWGKRVSKNP